MEKDLDGAAEKLRTNLGAVLIDVNGKDDTVADLTVHNQKIIDDCKGSKQNEEIAMTLSKAKDAAVIVGIQALSNPNMSLIQEHC